MPCKLVKYNGTYPPTDENLNMARCFRDVLDKEFPDFCFTIILHEQLFHCIATIDDNSKELTVSYNKYSGCGIELRSASRKRKFFKSNRTNLIEDCIEELKEYLKKHPIHRKNNNQVWVDTVEDYK